MKRVFPFFIFVILIFFRTSLARQENKNHLVIGLTFFTPYTTGTTEGPKTVINIVLLPESGPYVFNNAFRSDVLFGISAGIRLDKLRTLFIISYRGAQIVEPIGASGGEIEFSCRYLFWEYGPANLSGIIKDGSIIFVILEISFP